MSKYNPHDGKDSTKIRIECGILVNNKTNHMAIRSFKYNGKCLFPELIVSIILLV